MRWPYGVARECTSHMPVRSNYDLILNADAICPIHQGPVKLSFAQAMSGPNIRSKMGLGL
jgi:hypothetical protein